MSYVSVEHHERVAVVTLNDPERRNTLSFPLCDELVAAMESLESDASTGAVVITGAAPAFCAGAALGDLGDSRQAGLERIYAGFLRVAHSPLPTVAAVNGAAVGAGMNLALACDVRLAARSAKFDTRFLDLGIHPGGGHTWMFRNVAGLQATMAAVLFGQSLDGAEAERVGLVWRCLDDDSLLEAAIAMADRAASSPTALTRAVKQTIKEMGTVESHADAVAKELEVQLWSMDQPEFAERLAAMQQKISKPR